MKHSPQDKKKPQASPNPQNGNKFPNSETLRHSPEQINLDSWIESLRVAYLKVNRNQWTLGDLFNRFAVWYEEEVYLGKKKIKNTDIVRLMKVKKTSRYVSYLRQTAAAFPPELRDDEIPWTIYQRSLRANNAVQEAKRTIEPEDIVAAFKENKFEPREVRAHYENKKADETGEDMAQQAAYEKPSEIINNIHLGRWEDIAKRMIEEGIKPHIIYADPPFFYNGREFKTYSRIKRTDTKKSPKGIDTGITTIEQYYDSVFELFRMAKRMLDPDNANAVLLIHQHGGYTDDPKLLMYAKRQGWYSQCPLNWIKGKETSKEFAGDMPGQGDAAACSTQRILVFNQKPEPPIRIGTENIGNCKVFPKLRNMEHPWMHPADVAEWIMGRYLHPNSQQIIFEPFGCSCPAAIAAIKNNWRFIASEKVKDSYAIGFDRINEYIASITDVA